MSFTIKRNGIYEKRTGYILFNTKDSEFSDTVYVHQEQSEAIILTKEEYEVNPEGERIEVELRTNIDFDINIDSEWIKDVNSLSRGLENYNLLFDIVENTSGETRTGYITIENTEKEISVVIKIIQNSQEKEPQVDVRTYEVNVEEAGGLYDLLPYNWEEITTLILKGNINGDDISTLRMMMGSSISSENGGLKILDMSESTIVAGGTYYLIYQTTPNVIGMDMFRECNGIEKIILPNNVTTIDTQAFFSCRNLKEVLWGNSVKTIGTNAFGFCNNLSKVGDMSGVVSIGDNAFYDCGTLEKVTFGNNLESIGGSAFYQCYNLTELSIPETVKEIGFMAFENCTQLNTVIIGGGEVGDDAFKGCYNLSNLTLKDNVTNIEAGAFQGCSSLRSLIIPNSVEEIGNYAFSGCTSLSSIKIGENVKTLGSYCFENTAISEITIPDSVTEISSLSPFTDCTKLKNVVIGNGVTNLPSFEGFTSLESIIIGNSVIMIKASSFEGCVNLNSVVIGEEVGNIGESAFKGCTGLKEIYLPDNTKVIYESAFSDCTSLSKVTLSNVSSIGENAFKQVPISVLYCYKERPPLSDGITPFDKSAINKETAKLYVPKGSKEKFENPNINQYQSTDYIEFKEYFENIIEME